MKVATLCSFASLAGCVFAEDAYLWTFDHGAAKYANTQASSISSDTASSIIARRRGITDDRYAANADASAMKDVNHYGGYQVPMYGTTSGSTPAKVLVRISGYTGTVSQFSSLPDLWIEDANIELADGFKARKNAGGRCEYDLSVTTKDGVDLVYTYDAQDKSCMPIEELRSQPAVSALLAAVPAVKDVSQELSSLLRTLNRLSVTSNLESTLLILPPTAKLNKEKSERRADPSELRLDLEAASSISSTSKSISSSSSISSTSKSLSSSIPRNTSHPLPRFVPQCFSSQESCDNSTNFCSGHGSCYKAHSSCYKCRCGRTTVRENPDGTKKTVQWGGNACQKKDISMEFVLFAGLGIVLSALVAGSIGAMYTMGSQDLPSVLGAGVGGGSKQK